MLIAIQSYLRKPEKSQISNLSVPHKATREWGGKNPQSYYINNRPEIKTENKRKYQWNEKLKLVEQNVCCQSQYSVISKRSQTDS